MNKKSKSSKKKKLDETSVSSDRKQEKIPKLDSSVANSSGSTQVCESTSETTSAETTVKLSGEIGKCKNVNTNLGLDASYEEDSSEEMDISVPPPVSSILPKL